MDDFAKYCHENWVFKRQSQGWCYGQVYIEGKMDPLIRPYHALPKEVKGNGDKENWVIKML